MTNIKQTFAEAIQFNYTWLDAETRREALRKVAKIRDNLVFPEWIKVDSELDEFYNMNNQTKVIKGQYFEAILMKLQLDCEYWWKRLREPINSTKM